VLSYQALIFKTMKEQCYGRVGCQEPAIRQNTREREKAFED